MLTCKSLGRPIRRGERLIELPGSWFPSKFPLGQLRAVTQSCEVELMMGLVYEVEVHCQTPNMQIPDVARKWANAGKQDWR